MGKFLPNAPATNDDTERILGQVGRRPSRTRTLTLRSNGIHQRYYAVDPATGRPTHTNAQMCALAIQDGLARLDWSPADLDLLTCGTSTPDQLKPGHASMVHAALGAARMESVSTAGVCCAGMAALKYAMLGLWAGDARRAAVTGSDIASGFMVARNFPPEEEGATAAPLPFEQDFLRWMLSDGAAAALLATEPDSRGMSLRIDWIDELSLANELAVCMYSGAIKELDGSLRGWREADSPMHTVRDHYFAIKQDARLLEHAVPRLVAADTLGSVLKHRQVTASSIDWFLPHISSEHFRPVLTNCLASLDFEIPAERWFTNLAEVGNVGAASIYLALEALMYSGRLRSGQRLLAFIPESARFSAYYMHLTVV